MLEKRNLISFLLLSTLIVVAGCSMLTPKATGQAAPLLRFESRDELSSCLNFGTVTIGEVTFPFPKSMTDPGAAPFAVRVNPPTGCSFVRWEAVGDIDVQNPTAATTTITVRSLRVDSMVRAIYVARCCRVGGVMTPTNMLVVLAPYLALMGLVVTTGVAVAARRRRRK